MPQSSRVLAAAVIVAVASSTGVARQQPVPDFSGKWVMVGTEGQIYNPFGPQFTVTQDATSLTIASSGGTTYAPDTMTVKLDGSETERTTTTVTGDQRRRLSQAKVVTFALVITTKVDAGGTGRWEDLVLLALDGPGKLTLVSCGAASSMERGMITTMFKYEKQ
jgi:hypothetical protein